MKKVIQTILCFAAVLAALLAVELLVRGLRPAEPEAEAQAHRQEHVIANEMNEAEAVAITLAGDGSSVSGIGVRAEGSVVTIAYPGTYRVSGSLSSGQLVVDCGDYHGAVYLIMEGVDITCDSGPALYVKQADRTVLQLQPGTVNTFTDGVGYAIVEQQKTHSGAAIFSADDLVIQGAGALTANGRSADGIRTKDGLTVTGGTLTVYSADDGLQASDFVDISGGAVTIGAYGDGIAVTEGYITLTGADIDITCAGDGVAAITDLTVAGGHLSVTAHGGPENYETVALAEMSAKGMKGGDITITGGTILLTTADDAIHGRQNVTITGGDITIASGDDALKAAERLDISGGSITVTESYEALEADSVTVSDGIIIATAENNGVDAGEGGFAMTGGTVSLAAPKGVGTEGEFSLRYGRLYLTADGTESPVTFARGGVTGGTLVVFSAARDASVLLEKGELDGAILYVPAETIPAMTALTVTDADSGAVMLTAYAPVDCGAVMVASGALGMGFEYTLTAAEQALTAAVGPGCATVREDPPAQAGGGWGPMPGRPF